MNLPPPAPATPADLEHLKLIGIFHFVLAGLSLAGCLLIVAHYLIMSTAFSNPEFWRQQTPPPPFDPVKFFHAFVWFYVFMGGWAVISLVINIASGVCILGRRGRLFSLVVAGVNGVNIPFGTVLSVFTFIVLLRPSMPGIYHEPPAA